MSSSRRPCEPATDWAALPNDVLATVFLKLGIGEVMQGAGAACRSWRRVALQEPALWRRIRMTAIRRSTRGWRAAVSAAVDRAAGQCVAFAGPCDDQLLIDLVERAPLLQHLDLFDYAACNDVLTASISRLHLLQDLEISPAYDCSESSTTLFRPVCRACPRLRRLVLGYQTLQLDSGRGGGGGGDELAFPVMPELQCLVLFNSGVTRAVLSKVLDSCPRLESLHINGKFHGPASSSHVVGQ